MRALLQPRYGGADVLELADIAKPVPGERDVLLEVRASSPNFADKMMLWGRPGLFRVFFGLLRPKNRAVGMAVAGVVREIGSAVTRFAPGDEVLGEVEAGGACAEYAAVPESSLVHKPAAVSFEHAATVPIAGLTALQGLRDQAGLSAGQHLLINGASGGVGSFAIQVGKALGAEVTAVCGTQKLEQALALGADHVIDYTQEDFTAGGPRFDAIFDLVGNHTFRERRGALKPEGVYVASFGQGGGKLVGPLGRILRVAIASIFKPRLNKVFSAKSNVDDTLEVARLIATGQVTPLVEKTYGLEQSVDAFRYLLEGHVHGKLVITV